jgi:hypothetical protein
MATVIEVRTDEKSRADKALADARRNLHIAQLQVEAAKVAAGDAATAAGELQSAGKKLQADLCAATMRADHDRLAAELEDNQRRQRLANYAVGTTADAQTEAEQRAADLAAAVEAAQLAAAGAAKSFEEAGKQADQFASWRAAVDAKATRDAIAAADKEKDIAAAAARSRLSRLVGGNAMLDLYRQRATFAAEQAARPGSRLLDAIDKAAEARSESEPLLSVRMEAASSLAVWIDWIQDAAEATVSRLASARKILGEIGGRSAESETKEPLKSELARITKLAKRARDVGAPAKEKAVFDALRALHDAQRAQDAAELETVAEDPDTPLDEEPDLEDERDAVADAEQALAEAEAAQQAEVDWQDPDHPNDDPVKVSPKLALDDYELAIPADVLADLIAYFDAETAIEKVATLDVDMIKEGLDDAEGTYAAAEQAEVREKRAVAMVDAIVESRRRRQTASAGAAAAHKLLTIRGDR